MNLRCTSETFPHYIPICSGTRKNILGAGKRTNNKLNPHVVSAPEVSRHCAIPAAQRGSHQTISSYAAQEF